MEWNSLSYSSSERFNLKYQENSYIIYEIFIFNHKISTLLNRNMIQKICRKHAFNSIKWNISIGTAQSTRLKIGLWHVQLRGPLCRHLLNLTFTWVAWWLFPADWQLRFPIDCMMGRAANSGSHPIFSKDRVARWEDEQDLSIRKTPANQYDDYTPTELIHWVYSKCPALLHLT